MTVLPNAIDPTSEPFKRNQAHNLQLVRELRERAATAALGGPEEARVRHQKRGKLLARDRIDYVLDPGSPFLEIGQLAAFGLYGDEAPSAGVVDLHGQPRASGANAHARGGANESLC